MTKHSMDTDDNFYIKSELLVSKSLTDDIIRPQFLSKVVRPRFTGITVWPSFKGRVPDVRDRERYFCVVKGKEEFRLVSPVFNNFSNNHPKIVLVVCYVLFCMLLLGDFL